MGVPIRCFFNIYKISHFDWPITKKIETKYPNKKLYFEWYISKTKSHQTLESSPNIDNIGNSIMTTPSHQCKFFFIESFEHVQRVQMTNLKDDDGLNFLNHDYPMVHSKKNLQISSIEISESITYHALPNRMCPSKIHTFLRCRHDPWNC